MEEHDGIPTHNGVKFIHIIHPKVEGVLIKIFKKKELEFSKIFEANNLKLYGKIQVVMTKNRIFYLQRKIN